MKRIAAFSTNIQQRLKPRDIRRDPELKEKMKTYLNDKAETLGHLRHPQNHLPRADELFNDLKQAVEEDRVHDKVKEYWADVKRVDEDEFRFTEEQTNNYDNLFRFCENFISAAYLRDAHESAREKLERLMGSKEAASAAISAELKKKNIEPAKESVGAEIQPGGGVKKRRKSKRRKSTKRRRKSYRRRKKTRKRRK